MLPAHPANRRVRVLGLMTITEPGVYEGNSVSGTTTVVTHVSVADGFTLDSVAWEGGAAFDVQGLVATGTA